MFWIITKMLKPSTQISTKRTVILVNHRVFYAVNLLFEHLKLTRLLLWLLAGFYMLEAF